jgi:small-conductance mechanosensitive channel
LDARLGTISDLHSEINRRFADAGIEIAFPQRDLHLRSGWPGSATTDASDVKAMPNQNQGK